MANSLTNARPGPVPPVSPAVVYPSSKTDWEYHLDFTSGIIEDFDSTDEDDLKELKERAKGFYPKYTAFKTHFDVDIGNEGESQSPSFGDTYETAERYLEAGDHDGFQEAASQFFWTWFPDIDNDETAIPEYSDLLVPQNANPRSSPEVVIYYPSIGLEVYNNGASDEHLQLAEQSELENHFDGIVNAVPSDDYILMNSHYGGETPQILFRTGSGSTDQSTYERFLQTIQFVDGTTERHPHATYDRIAWKNKEGETRYGFGKSFGEYILVFEGHHDIWENIGDLTSGATAPIWANSDILDGQLV